MIFYAGVSTWAQEKDLPAFVTDSIERYVTRGMDEWNIPGLSVAIVRNGEVVYLKGFGRTSIEGGNRVDENTLFMIGSNTKAFTAVALSLLQQDNRFSLKDKVQKWMPEFKLKDSVISSETNIIDLLSHRIGLETFQGDFTYWSSTLTRKDVIQTMGSIDASYDFRTNWNYCNAAYVTAGELIPKVTSRSWEEMVRDSILVPLNMSRTLMLSKELKNSSNSASPHILVDSNLVEIPFVDFHNLAPAGGMSSTAKDMSLWLLALLNEGRIKEDQTSAFESIRSPYSILGIDSRNKQETHFYLYGLGLFINDFNGKLVYSHTGGAEGFLSSLMFIPEENLGIIVLTNTHENNFFLDLTHQIRDSFLGLPYKDYSSKSLKQFKLARAIDKARIDSLKTIVILKNKTSLPIDNYQGSYSNEIYGEIDIEKQNDRLIINFSNHPNLTASLEHLQYDSFLCTYSNSVMGIVEIPFDIENQEVVGLTLSVDDYIEFTPYEFKRIKD